jgi:site-specific DNA-cytosine methylase
MRASIGFAGGGLSSIALELAGVKVVHAVENNPSAAEIYTMNFSQTHLEVKSIADVDWSAIGSIDICQDSPPCQRFSEVGTGLETELDILLAQALVRKIELLNPKFGIIEQVLPYFGEKSKSWAIVESALKRMGYKVRVDRVNAANFGTPQDRERGFAIYSRGKLPIVPPSHAKRKDEGTLFDTSIYGLPAWRGWYGAIADLLTELPVYTVVIADGIPQKKPNGQYQWICNGERTTKNGLALWQIQRLASGAIASKHKFRQKGIPKVLVGKTGARNGPLSAIAPEYPSNTIRAFGKDGHWHRMDCVFGGTAKTGAIDEYLKSLKVVQLSPRCLARLQGLPDDFKLSGKNVEDSKMIGNGVAIEPMVAYAKHLKNGEF